MVFRSCAATFVLTDQWPDDVRLSDIEPRFTCQACGTKGADLRPNFHWEREAREGAEPNRNRAYARVYTITANATAINVTPIHTTDATSEKMVRRDMAKSPFSQSATPL